MPHNSNTERSLDERLDDLERDDEQHEQRPQWWRDLLKRDEVYEAACLAREENKEPFTFLCRSGVYTVAIGKGSGRAVFTRPVRIAGPIVVLAGARDEQGAGWSRQLSWLDHDGREHRKPCLDSLLHADAAKFAAELADGGLWVDVAPSARFHLVRHINNTRTEATRLLVRAIGWRGDVFVMPEESFAPNGRPVDLVLHPDAQGADAGFGTGGSFSEWRRLVAEPLAGNPIPMFALSAAFSGPLLALAPGAEAIGVTLHGATSMGKTTTLRAACSPWGSGAERGGYLRTWRATANGLEGLLSARNDTLLVLDELGQASAKDVSEIVYSAANGVGKQRAHRDGSARRTRTWRVPILSSGEATLEGKLEEADLRVRGGQVVRLLAIPVDGERGAFTALQSSAEREALAKSIAEASSVHYGHAGPLFAKWLVERKPDAIERVRLLMRNGRQVIPAEHAPKTELASRALHKFLLVGAAGELAVESGLVPWAPGSAMAAAADAFCRWSEESEHGGAPEARALIRRVRHFLEIHGATRAFTRLGEWPTQGDDSPHDRDGDPDERAPQHYGWKERTVTDELDENGEPVAEVRYLLKSEVLGKIAQPVGYTLKRAAQELHQNGILQPPEAGSHLTTRRRITGELHRLYVLAPAQNSMWELGTVGTHGSL